MMDLVAIRFSSPEDDHSLSHEIHQHSSQPSIAHDFRIPALASHPSLGLSNDTRDALFQHQLQRHNALNSISVAHPDFVHHGLQSPSPVQPASQARTQRISPPPPPPAAPSAQIHRHAPMSRSHVSHPHHVPSPCPLSPHSRPMSQHQFGMLAPNISTSQAGGVTRASHEEDLFGGQTRPLSFADAPVPDLAEPRPHGQLVNKMVINPPDLQLWREKLFNVDDTIILTNDEFETYFPHIDNIYSHRSTQKHKQKNFISHYWDCRMKGRPPGTPKSDDPAKRKRKRRARERDLCDVKIKITEHFPNATFSADGTINTSPTPSPPILQRFSDRGGQHPEGQSIIKKYWTIQRVNGNGGNGKSDGVPGPHKHTLQKSDEIKKSTVQRFLAQKEKEAKKGQRPVQQKRPSGNALLTARKHSKEHQLKLYAASFCPFSQRVWIALEAKGMSYQYCEMDPFKRPTQLLEANPRGQVPAIRQGDWASGESSVILEYLEDHDQGVPLLPTDPRLKANCRLWIDHINAKIVPAFFALMKTLDVQKQTEHIDQLQSDIFALVQAADEQGPYFLGNDLCLVDVHLAPFALRMSLILREFRNWSEPMPGTRWHQWSDALEKNPHVQATTSQAELYVETVDLFLKVRPQYGEQPGQDKEWSQFEKKSLFLTRA
ncbi:hypothetical protein GGR50DRAFT_676688 [Xylaria sp. CBS 124048]|nr:hypothetical protein GGR50DRAFT_676688 [Xylaria sp. CBS 124048]